MSTRTPTPLVAAVGLAAVTADGVRKLPGLLLGLPPAVVRELLEAGSAARQRYDELARHGQDVLGHSAGPVARVPADEPVEASEPPDSPAAYPTGGRQTAARRAETAGPVGDTPPPGLTEPVTLPEDVLDEVAQLTPGAELAHADLPLADFDHQTVPQLRGRLRTLDLPRLVQLRDYEQAHGNRLPVLTLLDNRIAKLAGSDAGTRRPGGQ